MLAWKYNVPIRSVEHFRRSRQGHVSMWCTLPNQRNIWFSKAVSKLAIPSGGCVGECQWNYKTHSWEVIRIRQKDPNQWNTIVQTLHNIHEDIKISDFNM